MPHKKKMLNWEELEWKGAKFDEKFRVLEKGMWWGRSENEVLKRKWKICWVMRKKVGLDFGGE
jgi:hypothetical protein